MGYKQWAETVSLTICGFLVLVGVIFLGNGGLDYFDILLSPQTPITTTRLLDLVYEKERLHTLTHPFQIKVLDKDGEVTVDTVIPNYGIYVNTFETFVIPGFRLVCFNDPKHRYPERCDNVIVSG